MAKEFLVGEPTLKLFSYYDYLLGPVGLSPGGTEITSQVQPSLMVVEYIRPTLG